MARNHYNKLVRDRIPEIIAASGRYAEVDTLDDEAYALALREKLVEEAQEVLVANDETLLTELADLLEVVDALVTHCGITRAEIGEERFRRQQERGAFSRRFRLIAVDE